MHNHPFRVQTAGSRELVFELADNTSLTARYYPSVTEAQLVLGDMADLTLQQVIEFAEHISGDGVAQVFQPLRREPPGTHNSRTLANELLALLLARNPTSPVALGKFSHAEGFQVDFPEGYFGSAGQIPQRGFYQARDGTLLALRLYFASSELIVILLHGATTHDSVYAPLARFISARNLAQVYAPTLRGHGVSGGRRGDVDYIGQLEDDIADLISHVRRQSPQSALVLMGHSMGGGLALRFASSRYANLVDGYILLAPYLGLFAPTQKKNGNHGWARAHLGRGIALTLANAFAISRWNDRSLVDFNIPDVLHSAMDTQRYSYRLWTSATPHLDFRKDLRALKPTLLLIGEQDQLFSPAAFDRVNTYSKNVEIQAIPNATHLGIVYSPGAHQSISEWVARHHDTGWNASGGAREKKVALSRPVSKSSANLGQ
jgi:alpha-beta hydrolase superfamily lysophospholipase